MYNDDPFSVIIERPPSRSSNSSHASSGFAASSVMTVYRAPNMVNNPTHQKTGGDSQPLLRENYRSRAGSHGPSPRDRKLSVIVDEEGNSRGLIDPMDNHHRPPSYEYDFDTKPEGSFAWVINIPFKEEVVSFLNDKNEVILEYEPLKNVNRVIMKAGSQESLWLTLYLKWPKP